MQCNWFIVTVTREFRYRAYDLDMMHMQKIELAIIRNIYINEVVIGIEDVMPPYLQVFSSLSTERRVELVQ